MTLMRGDTWYQSKKFCNCDEMITHRSQKKITQINVINAEIARIQRTSDSVITITQTSSSPFFN